MFYKFSRKNKRATLSSIFIVTILLSVCANSHGQKVKDFKNQLDKIKKNTTSSEDLKRQYELIKKLDRTYYHSLFEGDSTYIDAYSFQYCIPDYKYRFWGENFFSEKWITNSNGERVLIEYHVGIGQYWYRIKEPYGKNVCFTIKELSAQRPVAAHKTKDFRIETFDNFKYGAIDYFGNVIVEPFISDLKEGCDKVNGAWGVYDYYEKKFIIPAKYSEAKRLYHNNEKKFEYEKYYLVRDKTDWYCFDETGNRIAMKYHKPYTIYKIHDKKSPYKYSFKSDNNTIAFSNSLEPDAAYNFLKTPSRGTIKSFIDSNLYITGIYREMYGLYSLDGKIAQDSLPDKYKIKGNIIQFYKPSIKRSKGSRTTSYEKYVTLINLSDNRIIGEGLLMNENEDDNVWLLYNIKKNNPEILTLQMVDVIHGKLINQQNFTEGINLKNSFLLKSIEHNGWIFVDSCLNKNHNGVLEQFIAEDFYSRYKNEIETNIHKHWSELRTIYDDFLSDFFSTYLIEDQYLAAKQDGKWGILDKQGNWLIQPEFYRFSEATNDADDVFPIKTYTGECNCGYLGKDGNFVIPPEYKTCYSFQKGSALVNKKLCGASKYDRKTYEIGIDGKKN